LKTICLHNKSRIEAFLRRNTFLHIYSIGDLDDHSWHHTTWHASEENGDLKAIALLYSRLSKPVLLALGDDEVPVLKELLCDIVSLLPEEFYCHLSEGLSGTLERHYKLCSNGEHYKMGLTHPSKLDSVDNSRVEVLPVTCAEELLALYEESYPGHCFEPAMSDTQQYCCVRGVEGVISVVGVHVCSERYGVAAIGNLTTHPDHRRKGHARSIISCLCKNLLRSVAHIGLNVKSDNVAAIRCYEQLGFEIIANYEELNACRT